MLHFFVILASLNSLRYVSRVHWVPYDNHVMSSPAGVGPGITGNLR